MKDWTVQEEAKNLKERFKSVENQAKFARAHQLKGGGSMISQHLSGNRPISLEAALIYARAFNCTIEEISPRLAAILRQAVPLLSKSGDIPQNSTQKNASPQKLGEILSADELIKLNNYYRSASRGDRLSIMNLAEAAAEKAIKRRGSAANDHS